MNWLVYHVVSGQAFFTGVALLVIAAFSSTIDRPGFGRISVLAFLLGVISVVVSSTALPYWLYLLAAAVTFVWIATRFKTSWRCGAAYATVVVWLLAAAIEIRFHMTPALSRTDNRSITIVGDSVTAGVHGDGAIETWPVILAREHQLSVQNISRASETAASALKRVKSHEITASLVLVEIGGNDVLGSTTLVNFERDLDALLGYLTAPDRQVVMFELPLPPFYHEYGRIQRTIAAKHKVALVPKWFFLSVIANRNSTLDTIHLSQSGHQLMADSVWRLIKSAFGTEQAD
ncbi:MAG: acyl-CoA thioesterase [Planctomycetaceae bacterium]|nr:acyl-CoA thioesterase [Planctomycetaceae bacterium]